MSKKKKIKLKGSLNIAKKYSIFFMVSMPDSHLFSKLREVKDV